MWRYIFIAVICLLFLKAGYVQYEKWQTESAKEVATEQTKPAPTTPEVKTVSQPATTEIERLWQTWDWGVTTPGRKVAEYVDPGMVNWVLWGLVVVLLIWLVMAIINRFTGHAKAASAKKHISGVWLVWILAIAAFSTTAYFITDRVMVSKERKESQIYKEVNLTSRESEQVEMTLTTSVLVTLPAVNISEVGDKRAWLCTKVVYPTQLASRVVIERVGRNFTNTSTQIIAPESQRFLLDHGIPKIIVEFRRVISKTPACP